WVWASDFHNVVSGQGGVADGTFCSPSDANCAAAPLSTTGATYEHTFTQAGTYPYFCTPHRSIGMTGTIVVEPCRRSDGGGSPGRKNRIDPRGRRADGCNGWHRADGRDGRHWPDRAHWRDDGHQSAGRADGDSYRRCIGERDLHR